MTDKSGVSTDKLNPSALADDLERLQCSLAEARTALVAGEMYFVGFLVNPNAAPGTPVGRVMGVAPEAARLGVLHNAARALIAMGNFLTAPKGDAL